MIPKHTFLTSFCFNGTFKMFNLFIPLKSELYTIEEQQLFPTFMG